VKYIFLAGTACKDTEFDESKIQDAPDMVIEDRSGFLFYLDNVKMWAVQYGYPGTIDSVDTYLIAKFKNEKNLPVDVSQRPKV
jgi:hypothetical protein